MDVRKELGRLLAVLSNDRDEMANLVWAIETRVPLETGVGRSGSRRASELRNYLVTLLGATDDDTESTETDAEIRYKLMTRVPEHWIPFIPVQAPDSQREIELQRGAMLRILSGIEDTLKIEPRTSIAREGLDTGDPFFIHEEEVPRSGAIVRQMYQRARWHGGRIFLWSGRRKLTGRGEKSSGLKFDQIRRTEKS